VTRRKPVIAEDFHPQGAETLPDHENGTPYRGLAWGGTERGLGSPVGAQAQGLGRPRAAESLQPVYYFE
jgi:hypothetical protein